MQVRFIIKQMNIRKKKTNENKKNVQFEKLLCREKRFKTKEVVFILQI